MKKNERVDDPVDWLSVALSAWQSKMWTAMPATVQSFNAQDMTCTVQPAFQSIMRTPAGEYFNQELPLLVDCPVQFPAGGGCSLTFPVVSGDECMVLVCSRSIDAWWQQGDVQPPSTLRMHNLADAVVLLGFRSKPRAIPSLSIEAVQLRTDDGLAFVQLNPATLGIDVTTPGELNLTAPIVTINGDLQVNGKIDSTGDVKAGEISLQRHKTSEVTPGSGTGGVPVP